MRNSQAKRIDWYLQKTIEEIQIAQSNADLSSIDGALKNDLEIALLEQLEKRLNEADEVLERIKDAR